MAKVKPSVNVKRPGGGKGSMPGGGKGKSAPGGAWVFVPTGQMGKGGRRVGMGAPIAIRAPLGKGGFSKGGKGRDPHANQSGKQRKSLDKLKEIDADLKVWVGGLKEGTTRGRLYAHFKETCKPHLFELMSKGTACMSFKTEEDKQSAIDLFNNSELDGKEIQVDVWTKRERKEKGTDEDGEAKPKRKRERGPRSSVKPSAMPVIKTSFLKNAMSKTGKQAGKKEGRQQEAEAKIKEKTKAIENSLKAWVGGLPKEITWKELKDHFKESGCEVDMCDMLRKRNGDMKGTACVTFKTEDDATSAIGTMNGTELKGKTIEVDEWTMKEKKPKD